MDSEEWTKFLQRVERCNENLLKRELGVKPGEMQVDQKKYVEAVRLYFRCYLQLLGKTSDRTFAKLFDENVKAFRESSERVGERLFKYDVKFNDPRDVLAHYELAGEINRVVLEEVDEALASSDLRLVSRMFVLSFVNRLALQTFIVTMKPMLDILDAAESTAHLGTDWATAVLALCLEEALVKTRLREFGREPGPREDFHGLLGELMKLLGSSGKRLDMDIPLADGFRNVRNMVVHDPAKWNPTETEVNEMVRHSLMIAKALFPEKDHET